MLKPSEREKLQDCLLLIESVRNILLGMRPGVIPGIDEIQACFNSADQTIAGLLRN
jgi:hypothetical protein